MGWFDEQIRERKIKDQDVFEDSIIRMASVVLGKQARAMLEEEHIVTKEAMGEILKYYHYKPVDVPAKVKNPEEQMEYCIRPYGLMSRGVHLSEEWYKDAYGPILAFRKEDGAAVALLPGTFLGYWYRDQVTGRKIHVTRKQAEQFQSEAFCFYRPLPQTPLGIKDLITYLQKCINTNDVIFYVAIAFLATQIGLFMPRAMRILAGPVLDSGNTAMLAGTAVFMACVILSHRLVEIAQSLIMNRFQTKTSLSVEAAMMMRMLNLPADFFRSFSSGELSSRFQAVNQICVMLMGSLLSVALTAIMSLMYISQIFNLAPSLVKPAIVIILVTVGASIVTSLMQMSISKASMEYEAQNSGLSYGIITGIQKIKLAGAEKRAFSRWARSYTRIAELTYNPPVFLKANSTITLAISLFGTIILYYFAIKSHVKPSDYIAFNASYGAVMGAFSALASVALSVAQIKPVIDLAEPILKAEPETTENKEVVTSLKGSVELNNVCFRYKESMPYVIDGLNLRIRAGEYIAIVGKTGCGKSTLMRLLLGFEKPEKGAIYYDGKDIVHLELRSLRRKIGAVIQNGGLFAGDIYSNIVISAPQLTLKEAWEAAELAQIADDIRAMPMGMHTMISEGQGGISGGQRQRLMIARAVAPKPSILMFDEATSALDNKTQKQVSEALDHLKCTRIVIAHRLSTIKNCDRILVLDQGKIAEAGTYEQLIKKNGVFAELVERQRLDKD